MNNAKESVLDEKYTIRTNAENLLDEKNALLDKKEIELTAQFATTATRKSMRIQAQKEKPRYYLLSVLPFFLFY